MASRILSVVFEVDAQSYKSGRFTMPARVLTALGLEWGDEVDLRIETPEGTPLWAGVRRMVSGPEIDGAGLGIAAGHESG